tara:strand:+ start:288 stop:608 length:321 start_codon:yes stop_codon:yes gene_type:complete
MLSFTILISCSTEGEEHEHVITSQYTLTVSASKGGSVNPKEGIFDEGTTLVIIATPDKGYEFVRWDGSDFDTNNTTANCNVEFKVPCRTAVTFDSYRGIQAFFQIK